MKVTDFRRIALSFEGAEEGSHMGAADFRVGGRIFATLASQAKGYGNLMLTPELQEEFVAGVAGSFSAHSWRMGTDGGDPHSAGASERGRTDRRAAGGVEASSGKECWDEEEARFASGLTAWTSGNPSESSRRNLQPKSCFTHP